MIFWPFLGTITYPKTTFASMSPYFNAKLSLFLTEVSFETSEGNQLSYFQNSYFFKILWWSHEPHNKRICRWENEIISECFTINNQGFSFVSFSIDQTLVYSVHNSFFRQYTTIYYHFRGRSRGLPFYSLHW